MNVVVGELLRSIATIDYVKESRQVAECRTRAVKRWKEVCALPLEVLQAFGYVPDDVQSGVGIEVKLSHQDSILTDVKMNMHLTLHKHIHLLNRADAVDESGTIRTFILSVARLIHSLEAAAREYAQNIEAEYAIPGFTERVVKSKKFWMMRFLYYPPGLPVGHVLTEAHVDKGGFTFHLTDEHGRLEYLEQKDPNVWKRLPITEGHIATFPSIGLQETSRCWKTAAMHRVIATEESEHEGRVAAVCFVDFLGMRHFDKETYGSQQRQSFAYNYNIPPEQFSAMFLPSTYK